MTYLIDTDVLIDVALAREPHFQDSAEVLDLLEKQAGRGFVAWHTLSNFYYLVSRIAASWELASSWWTFATSWRLPRPAPRACSTPLTWT